MIQLGTRWSAGAQPPAQVPSSLYDAIVQHEAEHPDAHSWTLTWLEGRPRLQLSDDTVLTVSSTGSPVFEPLFQDGTEHEDADDEEDDWLS